MRSAITQRNTPQTHLKPRYTKELPVRACAEHAHAYACAGRLTLARFARSGAPGSLRCPSEAPPQESNQPTQSRGSLARFARSGAPDSLRCPSDPRSLRSLGGSRFPPMPLRTVPHRFRCFGRRERVRADGAAPTRSLHPSQLHPCSTSSGCRPAGGKPPARLRVLSVLARFARSQPAMRLVLRAAVRLRLSVGLLPTGSNALAFRAVCSRATLPQCANMFLPSPPPCGGRALRGGPRPAHGLAGLARLMACTRSCGLQPLPSLRSGDSGAMRPRAPLRSARRFALRQQGLSALAGLSRCGRPNPPQGRQPSPACDIFNLYLRAGYALAAHVRFAHPLKIQN